MPLTLLRSRRFLILLGPGVAYNSTYGCHAQIIIARDLMVAAFARRVSSDYHVISVIDIGNTIQIDTIVKRVDQNEQQ